jgi:hypothetical protein
LNQHLKHELHDLNNDGVDELFLYIEHSDWCGAGSNCSYWAYQKTNGSYKLLLEDKILRVRNTITNGYNDVSSESKMGSCQNGFQYSVTPYVFDGLEYKRQKSQSECRAYKRK